MCSISLCMIVKNEEKDLERCLNSVKNIVDEIIIVDTGSNDKTKEIAMRYSAKVFDYKWNDNFSDARNYGIRQATKDWILWMDADEELRCSSKKGLKKHIKRGEVDVIAVKMLHLYDSEDLIDKQYYISYGHRLFSNKKGLQFDGAIHEKLMIKEGHSIQLSNQLQIIHHGYRREYLIKKSLRNLKLIIHEKEMGNEDPWMDYYLASELFHIGEYKKALIFIDNSIIQFLNLGLLPPSLIYRLKYEILLLSDHYETTEKGVRLIIEQYPDYVDLHFIHGVLLYRMDRFEDAISKFEYCTQLGEDNSNYLIKAGSGSFAALYYMGECYLRLEDRRKANELFNKSLEIHPEYHAAKDKLNLTNNL